MNFDRISILNKNYNPINIIYTKWTQRKDTLNIILTINYNK